MINVILRIIYTFFPRRDYKFIHKFHLFLFIQSLSTMLCWGCFEENNVKTVQAVIHPVSTVPYSGHPDQNQSVNLVLQASGWIEPDPYPVRVSSLYDGTINEVFVLEGEMIKEGQKLVSLINDDAKLSLNLAEAQLNEALSKESEITTELALQKLSLQKFKKEYQKAQSSVREREDYLNRLEKLPFGSVPTFDLNRTRFEVEQLELSAEAALADVKIQEEQIILLTQRINSQKHISAARKIFFEKAKLDLERTEIFSPSDGRVLRLYASPGKRLMQKMDAPEASTALTLYNDEELQARVDVPISEASKLFIGQLVEISCSILPNAKFQGKLTRILGEADLQRNTLQVKIRIMNPDKKLRPEMLCRAKFYSKKEAVSKPENNDLLGVFVPISLRPIDNQFKKDLWVVGQDGKTAEIREVHFGKEIINGYVSVLSGLNAGDHIIISSAKDLQAGDQVKIINE